MSHNWELKLPLPKIVSTLADLVAGELEMRGIQFLSQDEVPPSKLIGKFIFNPESKFTQLSVTICFSTKERNWEFEEFKEKKLKGIAKEFGAKLARPFPVTTYKMELPHNVYESHLHVGPVIVRGVTDYHIETDSLITRFDILATWDD